MGLGCAMAEWEPINGVFMAAAPFLPIFGSLDKWANSPLLSAVVGGMFGAGFGAWAAGQIAKRGKQHDSIVDEIRASNLAMLLSQQTFHLALALKVDAVKPMADAYNKACVEYMNSDDGTVSEVQNLQKISRIDPPLDALRTAALERLTLPGPANRAVLQILESVSCLNRALTSRNKLCDVFMHKQFPPGMDFNSMYFGLSKNGSCHAGYRDSVESMARYTDESLFFSMKLCEMLDEHAVMLRKELKKIARGKVLISRFRLASNIPEGIIPDAKSYAAWFAGYETQVKSKKWWQRGRK